MASGKFATLIDCIDGRTENPLQNWIKKNYTVDYIDTVTEPGPDKVVSENQKEKVEAIKSKVKISIDAHKSNLIFIAGHHDCAGNPSPKEVHISQIKKSVDIIKSWSLGVSVIGLWVNEKWSVEPITVL